MGLFPCPRASVALHLVTAKLKTLPSRVRKSPSLSQKDQGSSLGFATNALCDLKTLSLCVSSSVQSTNKGSLLLGVSSAGHEAMR